MFHDIEQFVKSKYEDVEKFASEIAAEIGRRTEFASKAISYAQLVSKLEAESYTIQQAYRNIEDALSNAMRNQLSIHQDNPNQLYIEKSDLLKEKLTSLKQDAQQAKQSVDQAIEQARMKQSEYESKIFS
ncbi:hypothetical protein ROU88_04390 [Macrococcus capreoli]